VRCGKHDSKNSASKAANLRGFDTKLKKAVQAGATAATVLEAWRRGQAKAPTPKDLIKPVVQAFVDADPEALACELVQHVQLHKESLLNSFTGITTLDVVARSGNITVLECLWQAFERDLNLHRNNFMHDVMLGGYASTGNSDKVREFCKRMSQNKLRLSPRGYSLIIKGFLKNSMLDGVLEYIVQMKQSGHAVPAFAVTQFLRIASDRGTSENTYTSLKEAGVEVQQEALTVMLEDAARHFKPKLTRQIEAEARAANIKLSTQAYDALLKVYAQDCNSDACKIFKEMQDAGHTISEGFCVGLLARCAEGKFLSFADEIVAFIRAGTGMTIAAYSALMKVYAYSGLYNKACDLYDRIRDDGLKPDAMMYGCLMKFAVECGRTKLSQELSEKVQVLDVHNYMSLIRAAGQDLDVDRAFDIIKRMRQHKEPDAIAFNSVLDVCVKAGAMQRARGLFKEMKELGLLDIISYNTILKGYCNRGDLAGARAVCTEMDEAGMPPNDVSYNCMLNMAASSGNFFEASKIIGSMEQNGVKPDHYTVSIMLKLLKKLKGSKDAKKCLDFLDRSGIQPCTDEVLMNTVLETYIRHKEFHRLEKLLHSFEESSMRPAVPTYGSVIKAYACLNQIDKCWHYWEEMQGQRGLHPNDIVFGCMLDALVSNDRLEEAVELFNQGTMKPNAVTCSILIKGFSIAHQPDRAMQFWHEMRKQGMKMNTAAYNAMVDVQAKLGNMDEVSEIVEHMAEDSCKPDAITHSTIAKGYAVKGNLDKAMEVLRGMQESKVHHDCIIYNTILDGCAKHKRPDLVDPILDSMEQNKIIPTNFTLGILIKVYARTKQLEKAFDALELLPKRGKFVPNSAVWTSMMTACLQNNQPAKAMKVFQDMCAAGEPADSRMCSALITGLVRQRRWEAAVEVVDMVFGLRGSKQMGASIDQDTLESLLATLAQSGHRENLGTPLLERLRVAKVPVSGRLMASALQTQNSWANSLSRPQKHAPWQSGKHAMK
jgi:pentatricopeptide repeat protein